jgi:hypothetical protein
MKYLLPILLMFVFVQVFGQTTTKDIIMVSLDSTGKIYLANDVNVQLFKLSYEQIEMAKKEAKKQFDSKTTKRKQSRKFKYDFDDYTKQYVGYIDKLGNKIIYINAICNDVESAEYLTSRLFIVLDGGKCYFHITIDAVTKKCLSFTFNGVA